MTAQFVNNKGLGRMRSRPTCMTMTFIASIYLRFRQGWKIRGCITARLVLPNFYIHIKIALPTIVIIIQVNPTIDARSFSVFQLSPRMKYAITINMITLDIEMMYLRIVSMAVMYIGVICIGWLFISITCIEGC